MSYQIGKKEYLSVSEAGKILGVSGTTMRGYARRKIIPVKTNPLNKFRLFERGHVNSLLEHISGGGKADV